ncbi:MAG: hypothetical protein JST90_02590 [Bacteroidetes bacterium]|nr:hypothetical protein [Bacteroidota bacterium]
MSNDKSFKERERDGEIKHSSDGYLWNNKTGEYEGRESRGHTSREGDLYDKYGDYKGHRDPDTGKLYDSWGDRVHEDDDD